MSTLSRGNTPGGTVSVPGWLTALQGIMRGVRTYGFAVLMITLLYLNSEAVVTMVAALQGSYSAEVVAANILGVLPILLLLWATIRIGASVILHGLDGVADSARQRRGTGEIFPTGEEAAA